MARLTPKRYTPDSALIDAAAEVGREVAGERAVDHGQRASVLEAAAAPGVDVAFLDGQAGDRDSRAQINAENLGSAPR